jgi:N-dimethylarginine dimethylaminohydrolase
MDENFFIIKNEVCPVPCNRKLNFRPRNFNIVENDSVERIFLMATNLVRDEFKENTGLSLHEQYMKYHPQVLSEFEDEMPRLWGKRWKANTTIGKLRTVLLHRPGREFLSVGKPTPWPPHDSSLSAWRMSYKPRNLTELTEDYERLVKAYKDEGVEVVERKPDPNDPPYQVKAIYTDDVCHPAVYGQVILRMYDNIRKGEEVPTFQTLAEAGCPVVGMITGKGMAEGGNIGWLDEKHLLAAVHYPRANTSDPQVWRANDWGHEQLRRIIQTQDPEVDVRVLPGYGPRPQLTHYSMIDRHTSVADPNWLDGYLLDWLRSEMDWQFMVPPRELCRIDQGNPVGPETGVVLEPMKIMVPTEAPEATRWLEKMGVEVVEVEIPSLVTPRNSGSIHCAAGSLRRDPEPKS